jgi:hypothetical protein
MINRRVYLVHLSPPILSPLFMDIAEANPRQLAQTVGILGIGIMSLAVF